MLAWCCAMGSPLELRFTCGLARLWAQHAERGRRWAPTRNDRYGVKAVSKDFPSGLSCLRCLRASKRYMPPDDAAQKFRLLTPLPGSLRRCSLCELALSGTFALGQGWTENDFNHHTHIQ